MADGIGAIFQRGSGPTLRDIWSQDIQQKRYDQKLAEEQKKAKQKEDTRNEFYLNKVFDPSKFGTGSPQGPEITGYILQKRNEYAGLLKQGMTTAELYGMMQQDMDSVRQYSEKAKLFDKTIKGIIPEYEKDGFKGSELDRQIREQMFFEKGKDGTLVPKKFEDIDWNLEGALSNVMENGKLTVDQNLAFKDLQSRQLSNVSGETYYSNTPNAGLATKKRNKGTAYYDPQFDEVKMDKDGVITGVFKKSIEFLNPDGSVYINKETGKPADDVLTDENFDMLYSHRGKRKIINEEAQKRADALKKKGVEVTDRDMEYFKRDAATEMLYNNTKTRFSGMSGLTTSWRRAERPRVSETTTKKEEEGVIDWTAAPRTADGGYSIGGQTGQIKLGTDANTGRAVIADDVVVYDNGSVKILYTDRDRYGNAVGAQKIQNMDAEKAKKVLTSIKNLPGNKNTTNRAIGAIDTRPGAKPAAPAPVPAPKPAPAPAPKPTPAPKPAADDKSVNKKTGKKKSLKINYN